MGGLPITIVSKEHGVIMDHEKTHPDGKRHEPPSESPEERAKRVADIKRRVAQGCYNVDSREILYNMIKTAP